MLTRSHPWLKFVEANPAMQGECRPASSGIFVLWRREAFIAGAIFENAS
jgi:hypothetical protein